HRTRFISPPTDCPDQNSNGHNTNGKSCRSC
ncbi:hypothetical protein EC3006_2888, partial [Escherichia coli 3006]